MLWRSTPCTCLDQSCVDQSTQVKRGTKADGSVNGNSSREIKQRFLDDSTKMGSAPILDVESASIAKKNKNSGLEKSTFTPNPLPPIKDLDIETSLAGLSCKWTSPHPSKISTEESVTLFDFESSLRCDNEDSKTIIGFKKKQEKQEKQEKQDIVPETVVSFRFIAYNMANNDLVLDNIGLGFVLRRSLIDASSLDSFTRMQGAQHCHVSIGSLMKYGVQWPPKDAPRSSMLASPNSKSKGGFFRAFTASLKKTRTFKSMAESPSQTPADSRPTSREKSDNQISSETAASVTEKGSDASSFTGPTVDCVFGCFCESKFQIDEYAKSRGILKNFSSVSALQMLSLLGSVEGMKGKAIGKLSGDLKAFMLSSERFLGEGENIFCSFDNASQGVSKGNPIKSFLGKTFKASSGGLRVTCLGTHFPMQKVSSLMEDPSISEDEALQKVKCIFARCLQKVLRHLLEEGIITEKSIIILQGDLNSRCLKSEGLYVDALWETLQDSRLQDFISSDLPPTLRGEWREVVHCEDPGDLPVTYRFEQNKPPLSSTPDHASKGLPLRDVYDFSSQTDVNYRQLLERLRTRGTLQEWALYGSKLDGEKTGKFKPSRLPACTERVLYYAPASLQERCEWTTSTGYEVNYSWTGSDHKPVVLETTLKVLWPEDISSGVDSIGPTGSLRPNGSIRPPSREASGRGGSTRPVGKCSGVPVDFQKKLMAHLQSVDTDDEDSDEDEKPLPKTGSRSFLLGRSKSRLPDAPGRSKSRLPDEVVQNESEKAESLPKGPKKSFIGNLIQGKKKIKPPRTGIRLSLDGPMTDGLLWK